MAYVDGFVIPVQKSKIEEYRRASALAGVVWREHGALEYRECVGDDLAPHDMTPFGAAVDATPDETVIFAWITYRSRAHRDEVNAKAMNDPRLQGPDNMPFDVTRMRYGGFEVLVDAFDPAMESPMAMPAG